MQRKTLVEIQGFIDQITYRLDQVEHDRRGLRLLTLWKESRLNHRRSSKIPLS